MTEGRVALEREGAVAIARLERGVTNAIDLALVTELTRAVREVREDAAVRSLVLTSASDKFFSIGFDLPQLLELEPREFADFFEAFERLTAELYTLPKPTVAALAGHATAGGCILAICCDYRYLAAGKKLIGVNEVKLGVPVPYVADCVLRRLLGYRGAREAMDGGELYGPEAALALGLVDAVFPVAEVRARATEHARRLAAAPPPAFSLIKRNRVEEVEAEYQPRLEERQRAFVACWYSPEARARLREASSKF